MARLTVYRNKNPSTKGEFPLLLDVQSELLDELETRVVIPLTRNASLTRRPIKSLMPVVTVEGEEYVAVTQELAGIRKSDLGRRFSSIADQRGVIIAALDLLLTGI